ncbi:MAG: response regulator [Candidatus Aureabacteria bacterium]|nr:response regulator [Candidatus Auribacterota bacterium]
MADIKKILLIDDSPTVRMVMGSSLQAKGYMMIFEETAAGGLTAIKEQKPDLVLLDLMLPDRSGFDVLKEIKENEDTKNIPVIILTGKDGGEEVIKGRQLGADDYCVKLNTTPKIMQEKVAKLIGE